MISDLDLPSVKERRMSKFALLAIALALSSCSMNFATVQGKRAGQPTEVAREGQIGVLDGPVADVTHSAKSKPPALRRIRTKDLWGDDKGRPANLYKLTMDQSPICQRLLGALNQRIPRSDFKSYQIKSTGDLFLRNDFSLAWEPLIVPDAHGEVPYHRLGTADLNGNGQKEWLVRESQLSGLAPGYTDEIYWVDSDPRLFPGIGLYQAIHGFPPPGAKLSWPGNAVVPYGVENYGWQRENPAEHWVDIVGIDGRGYYLSTHPRQDALYQQLHVNFYQIAGKQTGKKVCSLSTIDEFSELTTYGVKE